MKKEKKDKLLQIRITEKEKSDIYEKAVKNGFESISAYLLWLCRMHGKE